MLESSRTRGTNAAEFAQSSEPGFELLKNGPGLYQLKIWGKFPPRWLANLTSGLSALDININRGAAHKVTARLWEGILEVSPATVSGLPESLDYLALTREGAHVSERADSVRLESFTLEKRDEAFFVEIEAADSVGFLVTVLKTFAFFSLFPVEVRIDTPGGRVRDSFRLKGIGGMAPSDASFHGLKAELNKLRH
jgi:hypothetical protein